MEAQWVQLPHLRVHAEAHPGEYTQVGPQGEMASTCRQQRTAEWRGHATPECPTSGVHRCVSLFLLPLCLCSGSWMRSGRSIG